MNARPGRWRRRGGPFPGGISCLLLLTAAGVARAPADDGEVARTGQSRESLDDYGLDPVKSRAWRMTRAGGNCC